MTTITLPRQVVQRALDAQDAALHQMLLKGVPTDPEHPARIALNDLQGSIDELRAALEQPQAITLPLSAETLKPDGRYNWKGQTERLVYIGPAWYAGDLRRWHQFAKVDAPGKVWCEVLDSDLQSFEETPEAALEQPQPDHAELLACMVAGAAATADRTNELEALLAEARDAIDWCARECCSAHAYALAARIDAALGGA